MVFNLKGVSKYGTATYARDGFKSVIQVPGHQFAGAPPATIDIGGEGVGFSDAPVKASRGAISSEAMKAAPKEVRKAARQAAREAARKVLTDAGLSL